MLIRNLGNKLSWNKFRVRYYSKDLSKSDEKCRVSKIRNIGIMAHIDAGSIKNMGEVHDGNTVTDYMEQERQRGITIVSAAVTFNWKDHRFNLIDTPGHIDFTMGVEQTLGVLDGAVVILDGSAGVEAQTRTVWKQADKYSIPRLVYVNKMDRADANFHMCLESLESKFEVTALPVQLPIKNDNGFVGILDLLTLEKIIFDKTSQGTKLLRQKLAETEDGFLLERAREKRRLLVDKLSTIDDGLANFIIEQDSLDDIPTQVIADSLRSSTIKRKGMPVLLGSSYKNIGVQPLMDAVIFYLPSPDLHKKASLYRCFEDNLSARAFKIMHDKQRGPITFFRVYSGSLKKNQKVYNATREKYEQGSRLYAAYADDYEEIDEVTEGNIGGLAGCKFTITGDLLTSSPAVVSRAKNVAAKIKNLDETEKDKFFSAARIPDPVFFCSIEPPSLSAQVPLENALKELEREDPSLRVTLNEETGQTVLGGMGELHIDIIKERIKIEYKIDVDLGPLQIAYKETITQGIKDTLVSHHKIGSTNHDVNVTLSLIPNYEGKELLLFDKTKESASNIADIHPKTMAAVKKGVKMALNHGPKLGVMGDLGKRRAQIQEVTVRGQYKVLRASVPLSELLGYSTTLRIITSGNGSFSSEFENYQSMGSVEEQQAIKQITGF
ncbi:hypothetical protein G9C98_004319 [Cotesia typhae]|uniref:Tr-type G domain-containing protein n=1 Tax=Cotesia typhae TaxID=2053667 RepID=A0A8J5QYM4_9HYME|nr:hypothetical protein G9C98_004319 [Cotesia typhae]